MLVMEWIDGTDLLKLVMSQSGPFAEEPVLSWMLQTCEGMQAAAEQGIIHRDLKPSNLLIDKQERVRVADFGLARGPTALGDLTLTGGPMGTPFYMAPEQAEDPHGVDTRADIYSFGATFYHVLTGKPPFEGETAFSILFKHKTETLISPKARNPLLSERTSELLERRLAKSPNDRFPSFAELRRLLQPAAGALSPWDASDDAPLADYLMRYHGRRESYLGTDTLPAEGDVYEFPRGRRAAHPERRHRGARSGRDRQLGGRPPDDGRGSLPRDGSGGVPAAGGGTGLPSRGTAVHPGTAGTSGGDAGRRPEARYVFHGITLEGAAERRVRPSRDLISEIMASCFYHADSLYVRTIAFPLLGTGTGGSRASCAWRARCSASGSHAAARPDLGARGPHCPLQPCAVNCQAGFQPARLPGRLETGPTFPTLYSASHHGQLLADGGAGLPMVLAPDDLVIQGVPLDGNSARFLD